MNLDATASACYFVVERADSLDSNNAVCKNGAGVFTSLTNFCRLYNNTSLRLNPMFLF